MSVAFRCELCKQYVNKTFEIVLIKKYENYLIKISIEENGKEKHPEMCDKCKYNLADKVFSFENNEILSILCEECGYNGFAKGVDSFYCLGCSMNKKEIR